MSNDSAEQATHPYHETERVYDEQMAPLVSRLIDIAKANGIPLLVSVGMVMRDGGPGCWVTNIGRDAMATQMDPRLEGAYNRFGLCTAIVRGHSGFDTAAGLIISRHHPPKDDGEGGGA